MIFEIGHIIKTNASLFSSLCIVSLMDQQQGSQVYQFDMLVDTVNLVQVLPDKTLQVLHFVDQHDAKNYILMISNDALPKIYRWSSK